MIMKHNGDDSKPVNADAVINRLRNTCETSNGNVTLSAEEAQALVNRFDLLSNNHVTAPHPKGRNRQQFPGPPNVTHADLPKRDKQ